MTARACRLLGVLTLVLVVAGLSASQPLAISPGVVIGQIYGGGGNTGAPYANDYIELFNRGTSTVSLSGMSVQYASATGTGNFGSNPVTPLSGSLAPGQYYLIQQAGGATGSPLPTPDATGTVNMSATGGKVIVANTTTGLACNGGSTLCSAAQLALIVDLIGYDGANFFEGSAAPTLSNTTAALRVSNGCTETDDNASDFAAGAPTPRNTASPLNACSAGVSLTIDDVSANEGNSGTTSFDFTVSLSAPAGTGGVTFDIATADGTAQDDTPATEDNDYAAKSLTGQTIPAGSSSDIFSVLVNGDITPEANETFFVNVTNVTGATVADGRGQGTIQGDDALRIHDLQGASHRSSFHGLTVSNVAGIVTAKRSNGFYMQEPDAGVDANEATSEGIFVFTNSAPTVSLGDAVSVGGTVTEFRAGGTASTNLTTTEITTPSITVNSSGNALPAATIIGTGGRVPPIEVIEDDATGDVETSGAFDPASDGIDFYESLEGMHVQVNDAVAVGPRADFGSNREIPIVASGTNSGARTTRGGIVIRPNDFNPERIILNDLIAGGPVLPSVDVADTFPGATLGVIDYSFGNFKLEVTQLPSAVSGGLTREVATAAAASNELAIGTFNVENLDPSDPPSKFSTLAGLIVSNLKSPDILAVEEIQDNNGATNDAVVDATTTYDMLIAAIQAAGGPTYDFRQIDPVDDQDGGEPGGNIRVGFLFRTDRGLAFIDRPGGTSTDATAVFNSGGVPQLSFSPGRIAPTNSAFNASRKPVAGEFTFNGETLFVIANHFNSKGGDQPLFGHFQPPTLSSATQRNQQAQLVNDFIDAILGVDADAKVVVAGDLNDFEFSTPLGTLKGGVLNALIETLPQEERYTYVFEGNSQTLDHILLSDALFNGTYAYDVVHVNAEFADQTSDHDPQVVRLSIGNAAPTITVAPGGQCASSGGRMNLTVQDADGDPLTLTASSSNTSLVPNGNIVFGGSGADRTVSITANASASVAAATITITVSDGLSSASTTINLVSGTNASETLTGTAGADLMVGRNGNDTMNALAGNDLLCSGRGIGTLNGGDGHDTIEGERGNDLLRGDAGNDILRGGQGNDMLTGGADADRFSGGPGADTATDFNAGQGDTTDGT